MDREFIYNFDSNVGFFGSGRGLNGRGAPVGSIWTEFQLERSHCDPFHDQSHDICATGSNSGAPECLEMSPLTSRTALERRSVSSGSNLSGFFFERSHDDPFREQHAPPYDVRAGPGLGPGPSLHTSSPLRLKILKIEGLDF